MNGLINYFSDSNADKAYARQRLADSKAPIVSASSWDVVNIRTSDQNDDRRLAHNISSRCKRDDKTFGKTGENVDEFLPGYLEATND